MTGDALGPLTSGWDAISGEAPEAPVLLALGRHDYVVPPSLWDDVAPRVPGVTRAIFERSGHYPFFEEPDRFVDVLDEWLHRSH